MAKTPLLERLRRAYQIARFAERRSISSATALEIWEMRISRRRLFQGSLVAAGTLSALAFESQLHPQVDAAIPSVLIVGAGIAGLTAAYYLDRSGVPVRIVEASKRVGGRMLSAKELGTETTVELGQQRRHKCRSFRIIA